MGNSSNSLTLLNVAKEFNIGVKTILDFLHKSRFRVSKLNNPYSILSKDMYAALKAEFESDRLIKAASKQIKAFTYQGSKAEYELNLSRVNSLITSCLANKSTTLDLGRCGLSSQDFLKGTELDINLRKCTHLKTLILSNEWWTWKGRQKWWSINYSQNIGHNNYFKTLPDAVEELTDLTTLISCGEMNSSWDIKNINSVQELVKLEYLDLRDNQIESVKACKELFSLKFLYVNRNRIRDIKNLSKLKKIEHLDIHTNFIENTESLSELKALKILDIHNNNIKRIHGFENLNNLEELYIEENQIHQIDGLEFLLDRNELFFLRINDNPLIKTYQLNLIVFENHLKFIRDIVIRHLDKSKKSILRYPVKILMLGNHNSGKSSIVDFFTKEVNVGTTHILRIVNYFIDQTTHKDVLPDAIFFDFGGQDFYHGIYQAFISDQSLQIIVFDSRNDKNQVDTDINNVAIVNYNRTYWIGQKKYRESKTDHCPYVLVQTFADQKINEELPPTQFNEFGLKKTFFLSFFHENFDDNELQYFNAGKDYFKAYVNNLLVKSQISREEPIWFIQFLKYIFQKKEDAYAPTTINDVLKNYKVEGLTTTEKLESLVTNLINLDRHGLILYYPTITGIEDLVWLNPEALVTYIQKNILNKTLLEKTAKKYPGIISKNNLEKLAKDKKIIKLLEVQKIIFLHCPTLDPKNDEYIIPNYLPIAGENDPDVQLLIFGLEAPKFIIKFNDFIPFGFINQMICFYGKQPDSKKFWRNRLIFTLENNIRISIEMDFELLQIKVNFSQRHKSLYKESDIIEYLFVSIMALYWNFHFTQIITFLEFLDYKREILPTNTSLATKHHYWNILQMDKQYIPNDEFISLDGLNYISYLDLFESSEFAYQISSYQILNNRISLSTQKELSVKLFKSFSFKNLAIMKNIFISYSKFDEEYLQEFEDHLITLKQEGFATFNCRKIEFGKEWDEEIKRQIDECDIMVCLISVKFLNTDYITKIEIPRAIELNKMIIPIVIKSCDWENSVIGKYQAAQRGKVVSLDNNLQLLGQIKGHTREERDSFWTNIIKEFRTKILSS